MLALPALLREFAVTPDALLSKFGISESLLDYPENTLPIATAGLLLQDCARATGCPHFGLLLGQRNDSSALGAVGFFARNAPDVATALNELVAYLDLHDRGATSFLNCCGPTAMLGYVIGAPEIDGADQIDDCALAITWNIMRALCGADWRPSEVHLRHAPPDDDEPWRRFFQAPVRFAADDSALLFRASFLARKVDGADPLLRHYFQQRIREMRQSADQDFRDKVQQALLLLINSGRCTRDELANHFAIHPRTLNRRLQNAGTSFRALQNRARHETARLLLRDSGNTIEAIATLLGYSEVTAFNRAFSNWEGLPPGAWRKRALTI